MKKSILVGAPKGNGRDNEPGDNVMGNVQEKKQEQDAGKETEECLPSAAGCSCPERPSAEARGAAGWKAQHERLVQDATTANKLDVVFVGDSITERWNGTKGLGSKKIQGGREAFNKFFTRQGGANMDAIPLGSAGDQTTHLLWHFQNGMLPDTLRPQVWVVLIGTNDIGISRCSADRAFVRIVSVVQYLQTQRPESQILLHGLLPRSERMGSAKLGEKHEAVVRVNQQLLAHADQDPNMTYLDVASVFLRDNEENGGREINTATMPDSLHPNVDGLLAWAPLIEAELIKLLR